VAYRDPKPEGLQRDFRAELNAARQEVLGDVPPPVGDRATDPREGPQFDTVAIALLVRWIERLAAEIDELGERIDRGDDPGDRVL
jgi:hypothetical protein